MSLGHVYLFIKRNRQSNLVKLRMSSEICPFCGKPFKRLKSHLPHCKMSPGSKTVKITNKPKEMLTTTFKHTRNKDKTNIMNTDPKLNYPKFQANAKFPVKSKSKHAETLSMDKELFQNTSFTLTTAASKVPSGMNTDRLKPKIKWLAKREQEMKQTKIRTQTINEFTSVSQQANLDSQTCKIPIKDTSLLENEIADGNKNLMGTSLPSQLTTSCPASAPVQMGAWTTGSQAKQCMPDCKENAHVTEQKQNSPKPLTKDCTVGSRVKEPCVCLFETKTCVWDHINHGFYKMRHECVPEFLPIVSAQNVSFTKCVKPYTGNNQNTTMKTSPAQSPMLQTLVQRPVEDMLRSQLPNTSVMAYSPEMATCYGRTFFYSSHSEISTKENLLVKCQTSKSLQNQDLVTELRLEDVRLNKLASWLGARTPKSPREAVTMFNKGWQWYYRKYIDVQKGGIGGIAMLIGGYCVLSYIWNYPHIKKHRWRKHH